MLVRVFHSYLLVGPHPYLVETDRIPDPGISNSLTGCVCFLPY